MIVEQAARPVLDAAICEQLLMLERSSPGFLRRLVSGFVARQSRAIADGSLQLQQADLAALRSTAHTLKGSSSSLGATDLARLASELEVAADSGDHGRCHALMNDLRPAFDAAAQALRAWVDA